MRRVDKNSSFAPFSEKEVNRRIDRQVAAAFEKDPIFKAIRENHLRSMPSNPGSDSSSTNRINLQDSLNGLSSAPMKRVMENNGHADHTAKKSKANSTPTESEDGSTSSSGSTRGRTSPKLGSANAKLLGQQMRSITSHISESPRTSESPQSDINDIPRIPLPSSSLQSQAINEEGAEEHGGVPLPTTTPTLKSKIKKTWEEDVPNSAPAKMDSKRKWKRKDTSGEDDPLAVDIDSIDLPASPPPPPQPIQTISSIPTVAAPTYSPIETIDSSRPRHPRIVYNSDDNHSNGSGSERDSSLTRGPEKFTFFFTKKYVFSNHYPCKFRIEKRTYNCSEQYYMYMKALCFKDEFVADAILSYRNPKDMKNVAAAIKDFDQDKWDEIAPDIMKQANWEKYSQDRACRLELFTTEGTTLVECNPSDRKWGIGMDMENPLIYDRRNWRGENLLGEILTTIREKLMKEPAHAADVAEARRMVKQHRRTI